MLTLSIDQKQLEKSLKSISSCFDVPTDTLTKAAEEIKKEAANLNRNIDGLPEKKYNKMVKVAHRMRGETDLVASDDPLNEMEYVQKPRRPPRLKGVEVKNRPRIYTLGPQGAVWQLPKTHFIIKSFGKILVLRKSASTGNFRRRSRANLAIFYARKIVREHKADEEAKMIFNRHINTAIKAAILRKKT